MPPPLCCALAMLPFIFLWAAVTVTVKHWTLPTRIRIRTRDRLALLTHEDVAPILQRARPRRLAWQGESLRIAEHRDTWVNLLTHGIAVPAVIGYVEQSTDENGVEYLLGYAFRHPDGRLEAVIDENGCIVKDLPPAFYVLRNDMYFARNIEVGQQYTALIDEQGRHLIYESLEIDEAATLKASR